VKNVVLAPVITSITTSSSAVLPRCASCPPPLVSFRGINATTTTTTANTTTSVATVIADIIAIILATCVASIAVATLHIGPSRRDRRRAQVF
jgi:hypothetical protein